MATEAELSARRTAEQLRESLAQSEILAARYLDWATRPTRRAFNYMANVSRAYGGGDTVPFVERPKTDATLERLGLVPEPAAPAQPLPPLPAAPAPSVALVPPGSTRPVGPLAGPDNDGWLGPYGWNPPSPAAAPAAVAAPAPAAAAPAPAPAAAPQELPVTYEALRYRPQPAPIVPPSDPVYDRWDTPSGRRIDAFLERELTGGVGVTNQMLAARQQQQVYDMRRSPQWEAVYQATRRNVGDTAAAAIADQNVAMATPGMSSVFEALLAPAARQAVRNARSEGAAVAAATNHPELNSPYYGGDFAAYGPIQAFEADAHGNPALSFRGGGGQMTPFLALDNTTSNYGLGVTAGEGGFPAVQERTDRALAALTAGFDAQDREAARLAEQQRLIQAMYMQYSPAAVLARERVRNQAALERQGSVVELLGLR